MPVSHERVTRPAGEMRIGGDVAERDDEVHARRARTAEMLEALGARACDRQAMLGEELEGVRVEPLVRIAARAVGAEAPGSDRVENRLRHDAQSGIVLADEQDIHGWKPVPSTGARS